LTCEAPAEFPQDGLDDSNHDDGPPCVGQ
jgi:hypothetical protein